ncbi:oxidoreductase [Streptomyces sp. AJS327]|uniref:NAD(P)/FAD-dependent oxidoreductase n=1 Tax=Streptomyces sp. AJS327 TaxID=2545265 RepID=UPI0015DE9485|nr:FAD-dependent oxidoreductase [Streptomyces sp. AJS327]MBA0050312.1 oxidoreductase [Streptomyces sp. AJS327]
MNDSQRNQRIVIVGAGMAGVQTAVQLRDQGWPGEIRLLGAERHEPYDRPPLSKALLLGQADSAAFEVDFPSLNVEVALGCTARALHPAERELETTEGRIGYDRLVIATGAEPVALPGVAASPDVHQLRTLDDAVRLRPVLAAGGRIVVVGAGWIGAEFATAAREAGCAVTVVEAADRPLAGALPAEVTEPMRPWYAEWGAELRTGTAVAAVEPGAVLLADGTRIPADAVVLGVGARPATGWLAGSGLELDGHGALRGDAFLRTSAPGVYAVGDCVSFPSRRFGERLLVHHWDNALQGPRVVAANLVAEGHADGERELVAHDPVPYFWSEQFGRFVQYAGHHAPAPDAGGPTAGDAGDATLWRGDPADRSWAVCWLRDGRLTALLAVGRPRDLAQGRRLIESGARLDPVLAADASVPLKKAAS